jgi:hypothetical protein
VIAKELSRGGGRAALGLACVLLVASCGPRQPSSSAAKGGALPAPRVQIGVPDARPLLGDLPSRAQKLGAGPVAIVAQGQVVEGERLGAFVEAPNGACLLVYARGSTSIEDLDVAAFSDEGNPVSVDEGPDPKPTLLVCPPHPDRMYVAVHAAAGEGLVVLAAHLVPKERAAEIERSLGAHGALGGTPRRPEAWVGLDDLARTRRAQLGGTWEDLRRVALPVDARLPTFIGFPLEADQCTDAMVVPDDDVALVDLEVVDAEGHVLARTREGVTGPRGLTLCSTQTLPATLQIRPHVGRGLAAVVLGKSRGEISKETAAADTMWLGTPLSIDKRRKDRGVALERAGYTQPLRTHQGQLTIGRRSSIGIDGSAGCQRIDIIAGTPAAWLSSRATDDRGMSLSEAEGPDDASLYTCGPSKLRLDIEAKGRGGPYAVDVRREPWNEAAFTAHPQAAARMLTRLAGSSHSIGLPGTPGKIAQAPLGGGQATTFDEQIPEGRCMKFVVGTEGEGTGIEARVFDATTQDELDRGHAARTALLRACAPSGAARTVRMEVRVTTGKLHVIVASRLLPP